MISPYKERQTAIWVLMDIADSKQYARPMVSGDKTAPWIEYLGMVRRDESADLPSTSDYFGGEIRSVDFGRVGNSCIFWGTLVRI